MNDKRMKLHRKFLELTPNVYFQPPESIRLEYPAIVYNLRRIQSINADDGKHHRFFIYEIMVINKNPDSEITNEISQWSKTTHERRYTKDNLYHDVFRQFE